MYSMAILCGGYGTRLGALTATTPKCLVDVNGRVFLDHVLRLVASQGVEHVVLCVGHLGHMVDTWVGTGWRFGLDVECSYDEPGLNGTAGALKKSVPLLGEDFFVLYGDSYLPCDLGAMQAKYQAAKDAAGMMAVCRTPKGYKSNVRLISGKIFEYDKRGVLLGKHIDYGLGILNHNALLHPSNDLSDVYRYHAENDRLLGYEVDERFHTIGTPAGLVECSEYLREVLSHST